MKKWLVGIALLATIPVYAQQDVNKMSTSGQSGPSEKSRYVLGLVRNGYADRLNDYFSREPWQIQTEIDAYTNAAKTSSVSIFCVAVDLGDLKVVKTFVENGIGPADLCRVQTFSKQKVVVSRAERLINNTTTTTTTDNTQTSETQKPTRALAVTWLGIGYRSNKGYSRDTSTQHTTTKVEQRNEKYTHIYYGEKKVVNTYFASPLDFATGEVFDYLWSKGFRSKNLFTLQALLDAKVTGRTEVWEYILSNTSKYMKQPVYLSQATYTRLSERARKDLHSFAATLLIDGQNVKSSELNQWIKEKQEAALAQGNDTTGYAETERDVNSFLRGQAAAKEAAAKEAAAKKAAAKKAAAKYAKEDAAIRASLGNYKGEIYKYDGYYFLLGKGMNKYNSRGEFLYKIGKVDVIGLIIEKGRRVR